MTAPAGVAVRGPSCGALPSWLHGSPERLVRARWQPSPLRGTPSSGKVYPVKRTDWQLWALGAVLLFWMLYDEWKRA